VDSSFVFAAVAEERREIANLLVQLNSAQLTTPSLDLSRDQQAGGDLV
jgi:hypothetical protein